MDSNSSAAESALDRLACGLGTSDFTTQSYLLVLTLLSTYSTKYCKYLVLTLVVDNQTASAPFTYELGLIVDGLTKTKNCRYH